MRIGIDARLIRYRRGMGNLTWNLLKALAATPTDHEFVLYLDRPPHQGSVPEAFASGVRVIGPGAYPVWEQFGLVRQARRDRLDVLHSPNNTAPVSRLGDTRLVITIHDVIYLLPRSEVPAPTNTYQRLGHRYRRWSVSQAARHADRIVTDSQHSKNDVTRLLGVPESQVDVVETGPGPEFRRLGDRSAATEAMRNQGITRPFVFALAASDPRKNIKALIQGFEALKDIRPHHRLVLAGSGPRDSAVWHTEAARLGLDVTTLGFVSSDELIALYNLAEFFVFPSLYEGFGLPVVEAMACGTPVIASNRSSIPEVAGGAAMLVDPTPEALGAAMRVVAGDRQIREDLTEAGLARVARYSWARTAHEMVKIYEGA